MKTLIRMRIFIWTKIICPKSLYEVLYHSCSYGEIRHFHDKHGLKLCTFVLTYIEPRFHVHQNKCILILKMSFYSAFTCHSEFLVCMVVEILLH
jgi:hypothetical protein